MKQVAIDLGGGDPDGDGDGFEDTVYLNATNGQKIGVTDQNGVVTVSGLTSTVTISNFEEDRDHLLINGQPVTVTDGQTVIVAAANSDNTGGTSTASDGSHAAIRAARPVHGIELRRRQAMVTVQRRLPINHRPSRRCWRSRTLEATSSPGERK